MPNSMAIGLQIQWTPLERHKDDGGDYPSIGVWDDCSYFIYKTFNGKWGCAYYSVGMQKPEVLVSEVSGPATARAARLHCTGIQKMRGLG
jgi:hypothetical protein